MLLCSACATAAPPEARLGTINLDTKDAKYQAYFNEVRTKIKANWPDPGEAVEKGIEGQALIEFRIARDGHLKSVELRRSSGAALLDNDALIAVKLAQLFPPVPDNLPEEVLAISAAFTYKIQKK